ncbi:hypothetical protein [Sphaerisporangium perillae]|uniref:hypothetical protein n=1 Tax=Sphaerisporangium perillae TaxID=2935860 RepID=UPI00200EBCCD|nr:hypothetical protein [Sphaerisporangium perillae]
MVGLLLFALVLIASAPAWYGSDPAQRHTNVATEVWAPGAWVEQPSTAPSASVGTPEHLPGRSQPVSPPLLDPAGTQSPFWLAWRDPGAKFTPQRAGHQPPDSRSPPLA